MTMNNSNESTIDDNPDLCYFERPPLTEIRFWLVTGFGSTVSIISVCENLLLFFIFLTRRHHRTTYSMYMMLLAFFDVFVSIAYVCLMSVNVLADYLLSVQLLRLWFWYMVPVITISHIAMTSSSFLILAASFERYCITVSPQYLPFAQNYRKLIAAAAILLGIISKGSLAVEFVISSVPECLGTMAEFQLSFEPFVFDTLYNTVWRFWYRNFVTIFMPFFLLAYLNARIVNALHSTAVANQTTAELMDGVDKRKRKATIKAATRTLMMVVFTYLFSNVINVCLTIWEFVDKESLNTVYVGLYAILLDVVSLLTNLACASRLPIYLACQPHLRKEILATIKHCCLRRSIVQSDSAQSSQRRLLSDTASPDHRLLVQCLEDETIQRIPNGIAITQVEKPIPDPRETRM